MTMNSVYNSIMTGLSEAIEDANGKGKKLLISKKPLNEFFQERSNIGYQLTENDIENIMPLMITGYYKKQE